MTIEQAKALLLKSQRVAVLTGAGISKESGIPTFRGSEGLWRKYRAEQLATPEAYAKNPVLVWQWYQMRFEIICKAQPNDAHKLLAEIEASKDLTVVTQNVDALHHKAGSQNVLELHGNLTKSRCERCLHLDNLEPGFTLLPRCSECGSRARPNVVWFGEPLPQDTFHKAAKAFVTAELALIIGTSGLVEPAASLAHLTKQQGGCVIEINPELTPLSAFADLSLSMGASEGLKTLTAT